MNQLHRLALSSALCAAAAAPAPGQVTITSGDVDAALAPGIVITSNIDTSTSFVDIGSVGGSTWDFSALASDYTAATVTVDPDTTPFIGSYPGATHAIRVGTGYSYFALGTDLEALGYAQPAPAEVRSKQIPPQVLNRLPMSMGTTWTASYVDSSYVVVGGTTYASATSHTVVNTVDAYGSLTLPGGGVVQALRLKVDRTAMTGVFTVRSISYQFLTKEGASLTVVAADTNQPATGTIGISNASWTVPPGVTPVAELPDGPLPARIHLEQNYPNPFNPSTTIRFSVAENSFVSLKVYDMLGREVAVLAAGRFAPGRHAVEWDGTGHPSGIYVYRLRSVGFSEARRFVLAR